MCLHEALIWRTQISVELAHSPPVIFKHQQTIFLHLRITLRISACICSAHVNLTFQLHTSQRVQCQVTSKVSDKPTSAVISCLSAPSIDGWHFSAWCIYLSHSFVLRIQVGNYSWRSPTGWHRFLHSDTGCCCRNVFWQSILWVREKDRSLFDLSRLVHS